MPRFVLSALAAIILCFSAAPASAAVTALVRGTVTVDGKPAAGATVVLQGEGSRFTTKSDAQGNYVFSQVPFGTYRIIASLPKVHELQIPITVSSDSVATVNVALSTSLQEIAHDRHCDRRGASQCAVGQSNQPQYDSSVAGAKQSG
jgi:hypothetical protein